MLKRAELTIIYGANSRPISAQCSLCGKVMPSADRETPEADLIAWFATFFGIHCKREHIPQESDSELEEMLEY
jgi:hypothetical protein